MSRPDTAALVHGTHFLDADNLVNKVTRYLDRADNRRLYRMCGSDDPLDIDRAARFMVKQFEAPLRKAGTRWPELSLSWAIPHASFRTLSERVHHWADLGSSGRFGFRIAGLPVDLDRHIITLTLVKGSRWR